MSVAKVIEISATSPESYADATRRGVAKASETVRNIQSVWVKEQGANVEGGQVTEFRVNLMVTFVLD